MGWGAIGRGASCWVSVDLFFGDPRVFQNCKELIQSVEETGSIVREIRDLEDQVWHVT